MDATRFELPVQHGHVTGTVATVNLVGYLGKAKNSAALLEHIETIAKKHPSRLILLDATAEGGHAPPLSLDVAPDARRMHVDISAQDERQIGNFLNGVVLRNIPTVLWWGCDQPVSARLLDELVDCIDEVIVDSAIQANREAAVESLRTFHGNVNRISLRDLAWLRGHAWRDAIARLFDHPVAREHLQSMRAIEVTGGSPAEAGYIIGWLASRLGWVNERGLGFFTRDGRNVKFLHTTESAEPYITEIRLASGLANFRLVLDSAEMALACFSQIDATTFAVQHLPFHQADDPELIEQAILMRGTDELFEASYRSLCEK